MLLGLLANDLLDHLGLWLAGSGVGDLGLVLDDLDDLLDLFVVLLIEGHALAQALHGLAEGGAELGEVLRPEDEQHDDEADTELRHAQSENLTRDFVTRREKFPVTPLRDKESFG